MYVCINIIRLCIKPSSFYFSLPQRTQYVVIIQGVDGLGEKIDFTAASNASEGILIYFLDHFMLQKKSLTSLDQARV